MRARRRLLTVVAILFLGVGSVLSATPPGPKTFKQDPHGLEEQFEPFLKAYSKGDLPAQDQAFAIFQLPDQKAWFAQYFRSEDVEQLGWDSEAEVDGEKKSLRTMMGIVGRGAKFRAHCKPPKQDHRATVKERESKVQPLKEVPVEQFEITISTNDGKKFSFLGNFVYVDGAYRYVGKGAFPFWSMPDANDPSKK